MTDLDKIVSDYELIMDNLRREMAGQPRKPIDKKLLTDPLGLFEE